MTQHSDIVDEHDRPVGIAPRRRCHGDPALIHRAVHVLIRDDRGHLLLQKRAAHKQIQPGRWDSSVGGHLEPGEDYLAAARREMEEELGLAGLPLTLLFRSQIRNAIESENVTTYLARYSGPVRFNPEEIEAVRYWSPQEIDAVLGTGALTPNFEQEWRRLCDWDRRYPASTGERIGFCAGDTFPDLIGKLDE